MTIWKFEFEINDNVQVDMPQSATIIHIGTQKRGRICLWAVVDENWLTVTRRFFVRGTGHPMGEAKTKNYVGTVMDGNFIWHVFEDRC